MSHAIAMAVKRLNVLGLIAGITIVLGTSNATTVRWCVTDSPQETKCKEWVKALGDNSLSCVKAPNCGLALATNKADLASFSGRDILEKGKSLGLKPIMGASRKGLPDNFTSYYGIAVVKKGSPLTFDTLKGKAKSCHTGVMKNSGWVVPVGFLLSSGKMEKEGCDIYKSVSNFFKASCAPGANDINYNKHLSGVNKLCQLCIGDKNGQNKCQRGNKERYYSYTGALKCLKDGAGNIAFIKQSTLLSDKDYESYELLCPNNKKKNPKDYRICNLARVPERAVLCSKDKSASDIGRFVHFLEKSDNSFGSKSGNVFKLYDDIFFSKSTDKITPVPDHMQSYNKYLEIGYRKELEAFNCHSSSGAIGGSLFVLVTSALLSIHFH